MTARWVFASLGHMVFDYKMFSSILLLWNFWTY